MPRQTGPRHQLRFGIGEWYGRLFDQLMHTERQFYASVQSLPKSQRPPQGCPFQSRPSRPVTCGKPGGVCSLRLYKKDGATGDVNRAPDENPRTLCPKRFQEDGTIYRWAGEVLLGHDDPVVLSEIGFLSSVLGAGEGAAEDVGRIDEILLVPDSNPPKWCTLEKQAVYFSGEEMASDFRAIQSHTGTTLPFPTAGRRPDYRSSGPKRLMPQLQVKVPSLRRWGKKMAVVVDEDFFRALGAMDNVPHVSNCDIAWFIVRYAEDGSGRAHLARGGIRLTTLERAVEGLTAGVPVSLAEFEARMMDKLEAQRRRAAAISPPAPI